MSIFTQVATGGIQHNTFDLSHERKFSGGVGFLIPCFLAETVPNDTFSISTSQLVRFKPLVAPVMHRFTVYTHYFFVPNRILWDNWEDFINGGRTGEDNPVFPFYDLQTVEPSGYLAEAGLADYLGIPIQQNITANSLNVSAMPFMAYQTIWYEFFRDQNVIVELPDIENGLIDGDNSAQLIGLVLRFRAWQHDYFTSALPWTQRGPEATIPLGVTAPLNFLGYQNPAQIGFSDGLPSTTASNMDVRADFGITANSTPVEINDNTVLRNVGINVASSHEVDLSTATASSINDLRRAFRLQEWLELNARGGARYNETIKVHFKISPGDSRLQRPEFLGGSSTPIVFSEVLQTSATSGEPTPAGNMSGHGISVGGRNVTKYKCREHGYIIGLMSVLPKSAYQQGLAKHMFKFDRFDYYWPSFANIGEQPILNKELYVDTFDGENDDVFGYTPRYAEYKFMSSSVHGAFRNSLDYWHAARIFGTRPHLNSAFISCTSGEVARIFAVTTGLEEQFYVQMHHRVKARRPMPYFGIPTI